MPSCLRMHVLAIVLLCSAFPILARGIVEPPTDSIQIDSTVLWQSCGPRAIDSRARGTMLFPVLFYALSDGQRLGFGARIASISNKNIFSRGSFIQYGPMTMFAADFGYVLSGFYSKAVFCPHIEPGVLFFSENMPTGTGYSNSQTETDFFLSPGILWLWVFQSGFRLGVDMDFLFVPGKDVSTAATFTVKCIAGIKL